MDNLSKYFSTMKRKEKSKSGICNHYSKSDFFLQAAKYFFLQIEFHMVSVKITLVYHKNESSTFIIWKRVLKSKLHSYNSSHTQLKFMKVSIYPSFYCKVFFAKRVDWFLDKPFEVNKIKKKKKNINDIHIKFVYPTLKSW